MAEARTDPQEGGSVIRAIPTSDVHRITSGQVVLDLQTAVKELIENALDASASNIAINFRDYGADSFEIVDNGSGIDPSNYASVALKHYTSKLASFSDLAHVRTFGFRGEALSSLCALASVTIHTATSQQAPMGTVLRLTDPAAWQTTRVAQPGREEPQSPSKASSSRSLFDVRSSKRISRESTPRRRTYCRRMPS